MFCDLSVLGLVMVLVAQEAVEVRKEALGAAHAPQADPPLGASKNWVLARPTVFIVVLDFPCINTCLLVWEGGLQLVYDN